MSIETEITIRSGINEFAVMDTVLGELFNTDTTTLKGIIATIETINSNKEYIRSSEMLEEFGISEQLALDFLSIDWNSHFNSNGEPAISFVNGYVEYICQNGSLVGPLSTLLDHSTCISLESVGNYDIGLDDDFDVQGLFGWLCDDDDPCSLCNTLDTVVSSAGGLGVGCGLGGLPGCLWGAGNAVDNVVSYAQDCG